MIEVDWDDEAAEKSGYETFMLKEIYEQPEGVARDDRRPRPARQARAREARARPTRRSANLRRIVILACGTSYHAGVVGRYVIEEWARIPVEPDIASEWRYRNPVLSKDTLVIGISQSGETADTLAAMKLAREHGARTVAITNMMGSQITRQVDSVLYTRTGLEVGVAASKTFTAQVGLIYLIALKLAEVQKTMTRTRSSSSSTSSTSCRRRCRTSSTGAIRSRRSRSATTTSRSSSTSGATSDCRSPRGRAQAEGDLVHPDRGATPPAR